MYARGTVRQVVLTADIVNDARQLFGSSVASTMGWSVAAGQDLAGRLVLELEGERLLLRFTWCDRSLTTETVSTAGQVLDWVRAFASDIADDLKEHRGRYSEALPWDAVP
jgi:hypothetical protein